MLSLLFVAALFAAPFEDTGHRFHFELPEGWEFTPQPSDTGGATFRRAQEGALAYTMVRVMPLGVELPSLSAWATQILQIYDREPGYRLLHKRNVKVGGIPAQQRRFVLNVGNNTKLTKMVTQTAMVAGQTGFVVHSETLAEAFPLFEKDFQKMVATFGPGPSAKAAPKPKHKPTTMRMLLGAWQSPDATHTLYLSPQGAAVVDGVQGTFRVAPGQLIVHMADGDTFYQLDLEDGAMNLTGGPFKEGQQFVRAVPIKRKGTP